MKFEPQQRQAKGTFTHTETKQKKIDKIFRNKTHTRITYTVDAITTTSKENPEIHSEPREILLIIVVVFN